MKEELKIKIDDETNLVVSKYPEEEYKEFNIYIEKNGVETQNLATVRQKYEYRGKKLLQVPSTYDVLVWADEDDEVFTNSFVIKEHV